jgi:SAM-dependent methyltransferase
MFLVRPPGVYRVASDTSLLIDVLREGGCAAGRRVLDIGTGTGALALAAAHAGAASVTAVDLSLRSVAAAWLNSRLHRIPCTVHLGDAPDARCPSVPSCAPAPPCCKPADLFNPDNATRNSWSSEPTVCAELVRRQVALTDPL